MRYRESMPVPGLELGPEIRANAFSKTGKAVDVAHVAPGRFVQSVEEQREQE